MAAEKSGERDSIGHGRETIDSQIRKVAALQGNTVKQTCYIIISKHAIIITTHLQAYKRDVTVGMTG